MRREKSLRNGVHHADAVVWGPVYRTRLNLFGLDVPGVDAPRQPRVRRAVEVPRRHLQPRLDVLHPLQHPGVPRGTRTDAPRSCPSPVTRSTSSPMCSVRLPSLQRTNLALDSIFGSPSSPINLLPVLVQHVAPSDDVVHVRGARLRGPVRVRDRLRLELERLWVVRLRFHAAHVGLLEDLRGPRPPGSGSMYGTSMCKSGAGSAVLGTGGWIASARGVGVGVGGGARCGPRRRAPSRGGGDDRDRSARRGEGKMLDDARAKVLKKRRSPRRRGRMGTSVP